MLELYQCDACLTLVDDESRLTTVRLWKWSQKTYSSSLDGQWQSEVHKFCQDCVGEGAERD